MAQSYEEVRRQAAEYRKQLDRIKAQEELQDRAEAYKKTNEYKILDKFSEPYDPEKYRVATSEFLDLVFFELNNYSYQKERNEKATDMLNAYEKSMSPYLSGKFSPEDLIVKKEEEIIEVVQSFPKEDIKDSKRDTKESYISIDGLYFHIIDEREEYLNDSFVTLDQISIVNGILSSNTYGSISENIEKFYFFHASLKNQTNSLFYNKHYFINDFKDSVQGDLSNTTTVTAFDDQSVGPIENIIIDLIEKDDLVIFFKNKNMLNDNTNKLNKINLFIDPTYLYKIIGLYGNRNFKTIFIEKIKELIKKHNVEVHIYINVSFNKYIQKSKLNSIQEDIKFIKENYNNNENTQTVIINEDKIPGFKLHYVTEQEEWVNDNFVTDGQFTMIFPYPIIGESGVDTKLPGKIGSGLAETISFYDLDKLKINEWNDYWAEGFYTGEVDTNGNKIFKKTSNSLKYEEYYSHLTSNNLSGHNQTIQIDRLPLEDIFTNKRLYALNVVKSIWSLNNILGFFQATHNITELKTINIVFDICNIMQLKRPFVRKSKDRETQKDIFSLFKDIKEKHDININFYIVNKFFEYVKEDIKDVIFKTISEVNNSLSIKNNEIQTQKKLTGVAKRKPLQRKASKAFPRVVAVNPKRKTKRRKVKPRRKQIANNKVNTASKNNINNDVPVEYKNPMVPINEAIGYNGHPLERKYYGINSNREYLELKKEIDEFNYEDRYVPTSLLYLKSADRKLKHPEDADQYYLETVNDNLDKYMFDNQIFKDELKEKKQKDQTYLMNYINTENYTKVNQLISALSNEELQLRNNIKRLDSLIQDTVTTNSGDLSFDEREDDLKDYVTLKKDHENDLKITKRQINQLLKIRQTMKDHKSDDVKYKRTPSSKKIITDEGFVDLAQAKEALGRTEENNIIYLSYEDFITQKEIKAIIDYNNRKRKK